MTDEIAALLDRIACGMTPDQLRKHLDKEVRSGRMTPVQEMPIQDAAHSWERDIRERDTLGQNWVRCTEYATRVEEDRDRLREALEKMEAMPDSAMPKARRIAREALAATEGKRDER